MKKSKATKKRTKKVKTKEMEKPNLKGCDPDESDLELDSDTVSCEEALSLLETKVVKQDAVIDCLLTKIDGLQGK